MELPDPSTWNASDVLRHATQAAHLHAEIHLTHAARHQSKPARAAWEKACATWHAHRNLLDALWLCEVGTAVRAGSGPWRDAALIYLEVSPRYHRSGYLRDHVCRLLKQSRELSEGELARIHAALLTGIERRPSVGGFKYDCRLAARWATPQFEAQLDRLARRKDNWISGRARRMAFAISARQAGLPKRRCGADV